MLEDRKDITFIIAGLAPPPEDYNSLRNKSKNKFKQYLGVGYKEEIYDYYLDQGLLENVIFLGIRRDIPDVLAASNVVVFPALRPHQRDRYWRQGR